MPTLLGADLIVKSLARENISTAPLCGCFQSDPEAVLIVEFFGETQEEAIHKTENLAKELRAQGVCYACPILSDAASKTKVW